MTLSDAPSFLRQSPTDLSPPAWLLQVVGRHNRTEYIENHGFTRAQIGPAWWSKRGIGLELSPSDGGNLMLTRGDLFRMADLVGDDDSLLSFLWHVLAWGSGTSRRNNDRRIESCLKHSTLLTSAFDAARGGNPSAAYSLLIRRGGAVIPQFGPAFFTKFLYFASESARPRCLILDARVARSLWELGWSIAPTYPRRSFSYNWYTNTYVSYCGLLEAWAAHAGGGVSPDMFERALFEGPPRSAA